MDKQAGSDALVSWREEVYPGDRRLSSTPTQRESQLDGPKGKYVRVQLLKCRSVIRLTVVTPRRYMEFCINQL